MNIKLAMDALRTEQLRLMSESVEIGKHMNNLSEKRDALVKAQTEASQRKLDDKGRAKHVKEAWEEWRAAIRGWGEYCKDSGVPALQTEFMPKK